MTEPPAYVGTPCPTCQAEPGERCATAEGDPFTFGGAHAARVRESLTFERDTP